MHDKIQPVVGIGAVVFHNDAVLLVKRKNPPYQNEWSIPGGKIRAGESLQEAAEREIREETGIHIKAGEPIYSFDIIEKNEYKEIKFHYVVIDLIAKYVTGQPVAGDDALDAAWVDRASFVNLDISETTRHLLASKFQFA